MMDFLNTLKEEAKTFNPADAIETDFSPLAPGTYDVKIERCEYVPNSKGTGHLVKVAFVTNGNRWVFQNFNVVHVQPNVAKRARLEFLKMMHAVAINPAEFSGNYEQFVGEQLRIVVGVDVRNNQNNVRDYLTASFVEVDDYDDNIPF